jgi:hypothetical protein
MSRRLKTYFLHWVSPLAIDSRAIVAAYVADNKAALSALWILRKAWCGHHVHTDDPAVLSHLAVWSRGMVALESEALQITSNC